MRAWPIAVSGAMKLGFLSGLAAFVLSGCAAAFLQTDDFPAKLDRGCPDQASCRRLVDEASARVARCQDNTVGYVRCADARADLEIARGYWDEKERERVDELNRQAALDFKKQREAQEAERLAAEQHRRDMERVAIEERQEAHRARIAEQAAAHERELEPLRLLGKPGRQAELRACHDSSSSCQGLLERLLEVAEDDPEKSALVHLDQDLRVRAVRAATEPSYSGSSHSRSGSSSRSASTHDSASSGGLLCRDGTLSPTCSCAGSHRGCCSHHGGVAGCAD